MNFETLPFAKLFYKKDFALFQNYKNTLAEKSWFKFLNKHKISRCFSVQHESCLVFQDESCLVFQDLQLSCCANFHYIKRFEIILKSVNSF